MYYSFVSQSVWFRLTVEDSHHATNSTTANITVLKVTDYPPEANAGQDIIMYLPHNNLTLSGNLSTDDRGIASWEWTKSPSDQDKAVDMQVLCCCNLSEIYSLWLLSLSWSSSPCNPCFWSCHFVLFLLLNFLCALCSLVFSPKSSCYLSLSIHHSSLPLLLFLHLKLFTLFCYNFTQHPYFAWFEVVTMLMNISLLGCDTMPNSRRFLYLSIPLFILTSTVFSPSCYCH